MRTTVRIAVLFCLVACAAGPAQAAPLGARARAGRGPGPYFSAPFRARVNPFTFGQSPSWTLGVGVLSNELDRSGIEQVYRSRLDGSRMRCLTCRRLSGPNGFAQERPEGDWILFCSMGAQPQHYGGPCLGGYGSDLYVMHPDGTGVTRLTLSSDPAGGARYDNRPGAIPYDNYHPYWSPDGRHLVWTRTEAYPLSRGGQRWEILLADFVVPAHGRPRLGHIRIVGPAFGVYETQAWAPDGSGFLFTAFGPRRSPFQSDPPGWMHLELYFMRLYGAGASPAHPRVAHLTDDDPAYEEQAVFSPDMREVIVMTSRAQPDTWYQTVITAAQWLRFDAPDPGSAGAPMFVADFTDPRFTSDLFMVDVATHAVRQLTDFRHVIPEFAWSFDHRHLLWTEAVRPSGLVTRVAWFAARGLPRRRAGRRVAPGLFGARIDMTRVRAAADRAGVAAAGDGSAQLPWARAVSHSGDHQVLPPVVGSYVVLLFQQLHELGSLAGVGIEQPPL